MRAPATDMPTTDVDDDEEGWTGTMLVEPLAAVAGGIVGGALVAVLVWRALWVAAGPTRNPSHHHHRGATA